MPHIADEDKERLAPKVPAFAGEGHQIRKTGELNYVLTTVLEDYRATKGDSYSTYNDILGASIGSLLEFYIRVVMPYEQQKCAENGDVYQPFVGINGHGGEVVIPKQDAEPMRTALEQVAEGWIPGPGGARLGVSSYIADFARDALAYRAAGEQ